ncbi:putative quinol monooxygenase [Yoonia sp.]|uniref:putative quinol monooxygenase n=1 Tax=Yoonia sp. TaxID=2212373 RepID=UPI0023B56F0E
MYAVCVSFRLEPGRMADFLPLMQANARRSLQQEQDCLQFDVLADETKPDEVFLYELYADRSAFDEHLISAHFKAFDAAVKPMIAAKEVQTWSEVAQ